MGPRRRRVVWTEGARRELAAAVAFVADESLEGAIRLLEDILNSADSLHSLPDRGRVVPERDDPTVRSSSSDPTRSCTMLLSPMSQLWACCTNDKTSTVEI